MKRIALLAILSFVPCLSAAGYVEAIYPLAQVIAESEIIAEGTVESHDPQKKIAKVKITKSLKGKCHYTEIRINYGGGQFYHPNALPKHLVPGAPAVIFYNAARQSEIYIHRFFCQLYGDAGAPPEKAWWNFTHIEIRMNRTFNGPALELSKLVSDIQAGKAKPPAPVAKIPPMDEATLKALPAHGEPLDEAKLPAPFRKWDPNTKQDAALVPVNAEGFIQRWLVLGPIPLGAAAGDHNGVFSKEWIPGQKTVRPAQLDKVAAGGQEMRWEVGNSTDFALDLGSAENSLCLALTYVVSEEDVPEAFLLTGSDDSGAWWLNGEEVQRVITGRGVGKDQDRTAKPVALKKGLNVLMGGAINGGGPTGLCARFVNKTNAPIVKLKAGAELPK